jgi:hypothetical protein
MEDIYYSHFLDEHVIFISIFFFFLIWKMLQIKTSQSFT